MKRNSIKQQLIIVLPFLVLGSVLSSAELESSKTSEPAEGLTPPTGTRHFTTRPAIHRTPLSELLALGSGRILLSEKCVSFTAKSKDSRGTTTSYPTAFSFSKGTLNPGKPDYPHSGTRILATVDGWLVFQRGKQIQMVPVRYLKSVTGTIDDQ